MLGTTHNFIIISGHHSEILTLNSNNEEYFITPTYLYFVQQTNTDSTLRYIIISLICFINISFSL